MVIQLACICRCELFLAIVSSFELIAFYNYIQLRPDDKAVGFFNMPFFTMPEERSHMSQLRKLAAIMFTDIVGYTSLMGDDEKKAFHTINTNLEIHQKLITGYNGRIVKELGDGLLAVFDNGTDAVQCAMAIQREAGKNQP